ncbi:hypothetical protein KA005_25390 [bacterium]|nr:hypothetical protein [bacterium]
MTNLETRIRILEKKLSTNDNLPACVIIIPESGRRDTVPDESAIVRLKCDGATYDREPQEPEETFVMRVAESAKAMLPSPHAVPVLLAVTENMRE